MAVNEITSVNPLLAAAQQNQSVNGAGSARLKGTNAQTLDPLLQNELLINEALNNLNFVPPTPADTFTINVTPPPVIAPETAQQLDPILLNELLINEALQNLNFVTRQQQDALLINETPPRLAATDALEDLNTIQQNELLLNTTLQNLNPALQAITGAEAQVTAAAAATTAQGLAAAVQQTGQIAAAAATAATTAAAQTLIVPPAATTVLEPTPITATFVEQSFTPTPLPFFLLNPDRTPYVVAVYETKNLNQPGGEPAPITNEVQPPLPMGRARAVDKAVLRQEWARLRGREQREIIPPVVPPTERDLRHMLSQVNEDLAASGLPLHLVFAKREGGYAVDVYDCSDNEVCRLAHDVHLDRDNLTSTLDNLQHETGIIINTTS